MSKTIEWMWTFTVYRILLPLLAAVFIAGIVVVSTDPMTAPEAIAVLLSCCLPLPGLLIFGHDNRMRAHLKQLEDGWYDANHDRIYYTDEALERLMLRMHRDPAEWLR